MKFDPTIMHTYTGIWIDHAKAFLIHSNKLAEMSLERMDSDVEPHHKGGHDNGEHQTIVNQHVHDERRHNQMKSFGKAILQKLQASDELLIFGPGTAKHEFKNLLEENKALAGKLQGVETADELSEAELKAFVKSFFKLPKD